MEKKNITNNTSNSLVEMLFTALYEMPKHILSQCASNKKNLEQKKMEPASTH